MGCYMKEKWHHEVPFDRILSQKITVFHTLFSEIMLHRVEETRGGRESEYFISI